MGCFEVVEDPDEDGRAWVVSRVRGSYLTLRSAQEGAIEMVTRRVELVESEVEVLEAEIEELSLDLEEKQELVERLSDRLTELQSLTGPEVVEWDEDPDAGLSWSPEFVDARERLTTRLNEGSASREQVRQILASFAGSLEEGLELAKITTLLWQETFNL